MLNNHSFPCQWIYQGPVSPSSATGSLAVRPMMGNDFSICAIIEGSYFETSVQNGDFVVMPGIYILQARRSKAQINLEMTYKSIRLNEFVI